MYVLVRVYVCDCVDVCDCVVVCHLPGSIRSRTNSGKIVESSCSRKMVHDAVRKMVREMYMDQGLALCVLRNGQSLNRLATLCLKSWLF